MENKIECILAFFQQTNLVRHSVPNNWWIGSFRLQRLLLKSFSVPGNVVQFKSIQKTKFKVDYKTMLVIFSSSKVQKGHNLSISLIQRTFLYFLNHGFILLKEDHCQRPTFITLYRHGKRCDLRNCENCLWNIE